MRHQTLTLTKGSAKSRFSATAKAMRAGFASFQVTPAEPDQMAEAHAFATRLIGGLIASPETLAAVHEATGAGLFVIAEEGELTGVYATILLSEAGRRAVEADALDTLNPAPDHLAGPSEEPAALYGWGIAAANHQAAKRLISGFIAFARTTALEIPIFLRPVTADGRRVAVERGGMEPVPGSTTGLFWTDPVARRRATAAAA